MTADEAQHARRVHSAIGAAIDAAGGWLGFEQFMDLALYAPGLGYYSAGSRKFGAAGDFTTAPEISGLFGACVARHCQHVLSATGGSILEVGAGTGRLAVDVLRRLETLNILPEHYWILEVSADLRARQRGTLQAELPQLAARVTWLDAPPCGSFDGVVLANEVLDALPVKRFRWSPDAVEELGVVCSGEAFEWAGRPAGAAVRAACDRLAAAAGDWDAGYVSEYCPRLEPWTRAVTACLRRGVVLWFDYGLPRRQYYLAERHGGTLICHFRQRANAEPLARVGVQDISAWVDFTALAEAGRSAGFEVAGFTTQAGFLADLRIDAEIEAAAGEDPVQFARLANQAKRLMLPGEMGEAFKAMLWTRDFAHEPVGFVLQDLRHSL